MGNMALCSVGRLGNSYDIKTEKQGVVFLMYGVVCAVFELLFVFLTVRFFHSNHKLSSRNHFLVICLSFHLSLISTILYFMAGVLCYGYVVYNAIANFSYLGQAVGMYAITMESFNLVTIALKTNNPVLTYKEVWCGFLLFVYVCGNVWVFYWEISDRGLHYFYLYNGLWHLTICGGFFFISKLVQTEVAEKYPSLLPRANRRVWIGVSCTIGILMLVRGMLALLHFTSLLSTLKANHLSLFTLYIILLVTIFTIFPCIVLAIFMQLYKQDDTPPTSAPEIKKSITAKKVFPKPAKEDLMEEMLNIENASENWV